MDMKLLTLFFALSIINVFLQTAKTLVMVRTDNPHIVAITQAIVYAFYTIILVYSNCELSLFMKCAVCGVANLIGSELSYLVVNPVMRKFRKDKLWKIEAAVHKDPGWEKVIWELKEQRISCNYIEIENDIIINCFCPTQSESHNARIILKKANAKYFVTEQNAVL